MGNVLTGFEFYKNTVVAPIVLEEALKPTLSKMVGIFADDLRKVTGEEAPVLSAVPKDAANVVVVGIVGESSLLEGFSERLLGIRGKKECYSIFVEDDFFHEGQRALIIAGSDKRGAIYAMFSISEAMGISPWYYFADAKVKRQAEVIISEEVCVTSKEPSVEYRGFFINDEQPCFGNWAKEKFGSIRPCPELYEKIFELLLRLKGNYIWPAMWRSDFTLDHIENAILANEMGVVVGSSHHEPCCRSGQEFQTLNKINPKYGTEWSFLSNAEGITEFWKDGLIRNKDFENLITIGMRGENDSYLMPEDATLEDNINVLKAAILKQKELIAEYAPSDHPQLLAIYKEVEAYYYGDETTKGLKDWDVLDNDIMMLCDDNFANVRTLPDDELRKKNGGFGMYYHFDYFGSPVSYLWVNSTPLTKVWEQMSMAYDYGVRSAWIVNVGDIKNQELPLSYFLDLAYDFDKWGTEAINKTDEYTLEFFEKLGFEKEFAKKAAYAVTGYVDINGKRRPEPLNSETYHPVHENEAERMLERINELTDLSEELYKQIAGTDLEECFYQLVYYPLNAVAEINKMQIYAGLNHQYIKQRKKHGNCYIPLVQTAIAKEKALTEQYHNRLNGKWNHMQSVYHIGFTNWNDEMCEYPICHIFTPMPDSRLLVSVVGQDDVTNANRWTRHVLKMPLCFQTNPIGRFEVANGGQAKLEYHIDFDAEWIEISNDAGELITKNQHYFVEDITNYNIKLLSEKWDGTKSSIIRIYGDNCETVADESENATSITMAELEVIPTSLDISKVKEECFFESDGCISIEAVHVMKNNPAQRGRYKEIKGYGRTLGGMKVFPTTARFDDEEFAPSLVYRVFATSDGEYNCHIYASASNPVEYQGKMQVSVKANDSERVLVNTIPDKDFVPWKSESWSQGVLDQIHISTCGLKLKAGINEVVISAVDPGVVLEKLVLWNPSVEPRESYLGPQESKIFR